LQKFHTEDSYFFFSSPIVVTKFKLCGVRWGGACSRYGQARIYAGPPVPAPRAANFQGRHIKKIEIEVRYAEKKKAVHEGEI